MAPDPSKSDWLRRAEQDLLARDPVDALNDVEALLIICQQRLEALFSQTETTDADQLAAIAAVVPEPIALNEEPNKVYDPDTDIASYQHLLTKPR